MKYNQLIQNLKKDPNSILLELTSRDADMMHMIMGVSGETGELMDIIKKHVIYRKDLDINHVIEELGDIEFYLEGLRQVLDIDREEVLTRNIDKLTNRYASGKYSDKQANDRKDKI